MQSVGEPSLSKKGKELQLHFVTLAWEYTTLSCLPKCARILADQQACAMLEHILNATIHPPGFSFEEAFTQEQSDCRPYGRGRTRHMWIDQGGTPQYARHDLLYAAQRAPAQRVRLLRSQESGTTQLIKTPHDG